MSSRPKLDPTNRAKMLKKAKLLGALAAGLLATSAAQSESISGTDAADRVPTATVVPEPKVLALIGLGLAGLAAIVRIRRRRKARRS
jgi:hypothetical protein